MVAPFLGFKAGLLRLFAPSSSGNPQPTRGADGSSCSMLLIDPLRRTGKRACDSAVLQLRVKENRVSKDKQ